ncbi:MAG: hypothetical protein QXU32_09640 [Nitrososphaerales archaeon]
MGFLKWVIVALIVALPILASFAVIPKSPEPQGIGKYINGIVQYWKEVIAQINITSSPNNDHLPSAWVISS